MHYKMPVAHDKRLASNFASLRHKMILFALVEMDSHLSVTLIVGILQQE